MLSDPARPVVVPLPAGRRQLRQAARGAHIRHGDDTGGRGHPDLLRAVLLERRVPLGRRGGEP